MNEEVLELVKKQESYRSDLVRLMNGDNEDDKVLLEISEILLDVNLITSEIRRMNVDTELHDLYAELVYNIDQEDYIKCSEINKKIKNYNVE